MSEIGRLMVVAGLIITVIGAVLWSGLGKGWLGRLPGDIVLQKEGFSFYFPIVTCILVSIILTILVRIFFR